jgi:phosphoglycolate phosphatase
MTMKGVLLDLDGTLVDTAPDMVAALNQILIEEGERRVPYALARNEVSNGAVGLLKIGFGANLSPADEARLRERFLHIYRTNLAVKSRIFIGLSDFFDFVSGSQMRWGVVTNKPGWLTEPLLKALGLADGATCVVSGDTLPQRKPDPAPLRHAAQLMEIPAAQCVYVGDAVRDIQAGRAAGMYTVAAAYGYISPGDDPAAWGADDLVRHPLHLLATLVAAAERHATRA